ncbi:MAG TPA: hypothetical protein VG795_05580, partial [Acidimicrobiia bacterium]|nr:hypothetical protein [Acidimicrobiia bacterium]
ACARPGGAYAEACARPGGAYVEACAGSGCATGQACNCSFAGAQAGSTGPGSTWDRGIAVPGGTRVHARTRTAQACARRVPLRA